MAEEEPTPMEMSLTEQAPPAPQEPNSLAAADVAPSAPEMDPSADKKMEETVEDAPASQPTTEANPSFTPDAPDAPDAADAPAAPAAPAAPTAAAAPTAPTAPAAPDSEAVPSADAADAGPPDTPQATPSEKAAAPEAEAEATPAAQEGTPAAAAEGTPGATAAVEAAPATPAAAEAAAAEAGQESSAPDSIPTNTEPTSSLVLTPVSPAFTTPSAITTPSAVTVATTPAGKRGGAAPAMLTAFTVQCAVCFKWRKVPTLEEYEGIRARISHTPFVCEQANRWKTKSSCSDPPDLQQDGKLLWAMDRPDIPVPPPGWRRRIVVRGGTSNKFSDVYYHAPDGKTLRSTKEVEKYLSEHPHFEKEGVTVKMFSFSSPRPLNPLIKASPSPAAAAAAAAGDAPSTPVPASLGGKRMVDASAADSAKRRAT